MGSVFYYIHTSLIIDSRIYRTGTQGEGLFCSLCTLPNNIRCPGRAVPGVAQSNAGCLKSISSHPHRMTLHDDLSRYWILHHYMAPFALSQRGGGGRHILYMNDHPIEFRTTVTGNTIFILAGNRPETSPCFALELNRSDGTATLQDVVRRPACFMDNHSDSRDIVRAAYILAQKRGTRILEFTDHSRIYCPAEVQLANLSFLTTGQTWYESILPITCRSPMCETIELFRQRVRTNTWRQVGDGLIDIELTGVDIDAPGSAMAVLAAMKTDKKYCGFFQRYMGQLLRRSQIDSLQGTHWFCRIPPLPVTEHRRTRRRLRNTNTK
jgi:hypothetical protein